MLCSSGYVFVANNESLLSSRNLSTSVELHTYGKKTNLKMYSKSHTYHTTLTFCKFHVRHDVKIKALYRLFQRLKAAVFSLCLPGRGRRIHVGGTLVYSRVSATTIAYKLSFTLVCFSHSGVENNSTPSSK